MTFKKKIDFNKIIKEHGFGTIRSDKPGSNYFDNMPYRTRDGKILKGISLFRTSPATFTNVGSEQATKNVDKLVRDLSEIGRVQRTSEFSFTLLFQTSKRKVLKIRGFKNEREGLLYDQTYHYMDFNIEELDSSKMMVTEEFKSEQTADYTKPLTNEYLDSILHTQ
jgi:hypothetical protein